MKKLDKAVAKAVWKFTDASVNKSICTFFFYQPKITEQLKKRLEETR